MQMSALQAGRLVFVAQESTNVGNVVFYSDDGGQRFTKSSTMVEHSWVQW